MKVGFTNSWFESHRKTLDAVVAPWLAGRPDPVRILEIGSFEGRSTLWWAEAVRGRPGAMVVGVDAWTGETGKIPLEGVRRRFVANMEGYRPPVVDICGQSQDVLPLLASETFDLVYVDGGHEEHEAQQDTKQAMRLVKADGLILWDDWFLYSIYGIHMKVGRGARCALGPLARGVEQWGALAALRVQP